MQSGNDFLEYRIKTNGSVYGNKTANLMELDLLSKSMNSSMISIMVPEIYPIEDKTTKAYLDQYAPEWRTLWNGFVIAQGEAKALTISAKIFLSKLSDLLTSTFTRHPISDDIINGIKLPADTLFMVRSTGEEDTVEMANPGGNKSVAAVKLDKAAISKAMGVVVASYVSEKSLTQRLLSGDDISKPSFMPILIQRMIGEKLNGEDKNDIVVSGVMYAYMDEVRIDAAPGHGELIVNSKAPFDTYDVTPAGIVHAEVYQKNERLVPAVVADPSSMSGAMKRKLVFKANPKALQSEASLSAEIANELANVGRSVSQHYGMPMDIEFVYHPKNKILYLVQARPIPQDLKHKIIPSAISPEKWAEIKKDESIPKIKCHVVKEAGNAVKVITSENQVILKKQIDKALKHYLTHPDLQGKVRAVIIKDDAPSTSHEAAFFNALGIPVLQASIKKLKPWLKEKDAVIIVDPQHQHLVNWSKKLGPKVEDVEIEEELKNKGVVTDGLFVSSMTTNETLLPIDYPLRSKIESGIDQYLLDHAVVEKKNIYQQMLACIEKLEEAKAGSKNEEAFTALQKMAELFKIIGTSSRAKEANTPHAALFQHAMLAIAEIHWDLLDYSSLPRLDVKNLAVLQRLLDAVAKLKALVVNPGKAGLYSDSIFQIAARNKAVKAVDQSIVGEQRDYLQEFLKLNALALRESTAAQWTAFAISCSKTPFARKLLARIIRTSAKYHFESELVNQLFLTYADKYLKAPTPENFANTLRDLFEEVNVYEDEFTKYKVLDNERTIAAWENRMDEWSDPAKFDSLYSEYQREVVALSQQISINDSMQNFTQKVLLKQVQRLTEMMDKNIKTLKGSPEYAGQSGVLVSRFVQMLTTYHDLMEKWMKAIPESNYNLWMRKIGRDRGLNGKTAMIEAINEVFKSKLGSRESRQLEASQCLSVATATVGTSASFQRQFYEKSDRITLEDLFSLMHQNILASTMILGKKFEMDLKQLPEALQPLLNQLQINPKLNLLGLRHKHPVISLEYNIPLDNHSAKLTLDYNVETKSFSLLWGFFGKNWNERMVAIQKILGLECLLAKGSLSYEPLYDHQTRDLECVWKFSAAEIPVITRKLNRMVEHYANMTELSSYDTAMSNGISTILDRHMTATNMQAWQSLPAEFISRLNTEISRLNNTTRYSLIRQVPTVIAIFNDWLVNRIDADIIYSNFKLYDVDTLRSYFDKHDNGLNLNYSENGSESLFDKMSQTFGSADLIRYIRKYNVDTSKCRDLLSRVLEQPAPDVQFVKQLMASGMRVNNLNIKQYINVMDQPELFALFGQQIDAMDGTRLTSWMGDQLRGVRGKVEGLDKFIVRYKKKIDFNYRPNSNSKETLLEMCLSPDASLCDVMKDIFPLTSFNVNIHQNLLSIVADVHGNINYFDSILSKVANVALLDSVEPFSLHNLLKSTAGMASAQSFIDKLSMGKLSVIIQETAKAIEPETSAQFLQLLVHIKGRFAHDFGSNQTLMHLILKNCYGGDVTKYLSEQKPDLSKINGLVETALMSKNVNEDLVKQLLACGAAFTPEKMSMDELLNIMANPGISALLMPTLKTIGRQKFSTYIYDKIRRLNASSPLSGDYPRKLSRLFEVFKQDIDLDYQESKNEPTMIEYFIKIRMDDNVEEYDHALAQFISGQKLDLKLHDYAPTHACNSGYPETLKAIVENGFKFEDIVKMDVTQMITTPVGRDAIAALLKKLTPQKMESVINENYSKLCVTDDGISVLMMCLDVLDLASKESSNSLTLLERIMVEATRNDVAIAITQHLQKYHLDLSGHRNVLAYALDKYASNTELIKELIKCGASAEKISIPQLLALQKNPELQPFFAEYISKWDKQKLSAWLFQVIGSNGADMQKEFIEYLNKIKTNIDFEYADNTPTLLELMLVRLNREPDVDGAFAEMIAKMPLDLAKHGKALRLSQAANAFKTFNAIVQTAANLGTTKSFSASAFHISQIGKETMAKVLTAMTKERAVKKIYKGIPRTFTSQELKDYMSFADLVPNLINDPSILYANDTVLEKLVRGTASEDIALIIPFLDKYKPDLSRHQKIVAHAMKMRNPNTEFIKQLLACGAPCKELDLQGLLGSNNDPYCEMLLTHMASMPKHEFSEWLNEQLRQIRNYDPEKLLAFYERFQSQILFNYKTSADPQSLLEICMGKLKDEKNMAQRFTALLGNDAIDLSWHENLLSIFRNCEQWGSLVDAVIQRGVLFNLSKPFNVKVWSKALPLDTVIKLLDKLSPDMLHETLANTLKEDSNVADGVKKLLEHYAGVIDLTWRDKRSSDSQNILYRLLYCGQYHFAAALMKKSKPDLSGQEGLLHAALGVRPIISDCVKELFACGIPVEGSILLCTTSEREYLAEIISNAQVQIDFAKNKSLLLSLTRGQIRSNQKLFSALIENGINHQDADVILLYDSNTPDMKQAMFKLLDKLSPEKLCETLYLSLKNEKFNISTMAVELLNLYGSKIIADYRPKAASSDAETLLELFTRYTSTDNALCTYLQKYKPDLSRHPHINDCVIARKSPATANLIELMKQCHAAPRKLVDLNLGELSSVDAFSLYPNCSSVTGRRAVLMLLENLPPAKAAEFLAQSLIDARLTGAPDCTSGLVGVIHQLISKLDLNTPVMKHIPGGTLARQLAKFMPVHEFKNLVDANPSLFSKVDPATAQHLMQKKKFKGITSSLAVCGTFRAAADDNAISSASNRGSYKR